MNVICEKKILECQLWELEVAGSNPVSPIFNEYFQALIDLSR